MENLFGPICSAILLRARDAVRKIELHDYVAALRSMVPDDLHPTGMATIWGWITDMIEAAEHDDAAAFARLAIMVADKVALELQWYAEDTATPVAPTPIITASHR